MPINWILFIVYLITSFFAAKKFLHHRFFYYLYVLAALDPVFVIIKKFFPISIPNITHQSIVTLFILFAYPSDKLRSKLFLGTIIVLSMLHFDIEVIVTVISNVLAFVFVSIELFELMLIEVKENGKGYVSAYHLLLLLEAVLTGTGMLLYQEAVNIYVRLYPLILSINITILFLLSIWGPIKKINITFLNKGRILLKTENGFFRYIRFNRPTNISNSKIEIPSAVNTINPDIFAVTNQITQINHGLTRREREVLSFLSEGLPNQEIASKIYVDKRTVENHLQHIKEKLDFESMQELRKFALSLQ